MVIVSPTGNPAERPDHVLHVHSVIITVAAPPFIVDRMVVPSLIPIAPVPLPTSCLTGGTTRGMSGDWWGWWRVSSRLTSTTLGVIPRTGSSLSRVATGTRVLSGSSASWTA